MLSLPPPPPPPGDDRTPAIPPEPGPNLVADWLAGRSPKTAAAYASDLARFADWLDSTPLEAAAAWLCMGAGAAHAVVLRYRDAMISGGLASATVARRLAALKSLARLARVTGRIAWVLEVDPPKHEPRRDSRGPAPDEFNRLWKAARKAGDGPRAIRDRAIVALLFGHALRRGEVAALDLADVDFAGKAILVTGKGRREKERITLDPSVSKHLGDWVLARGHEPGPLFGRLDGHRPTARLTGESIRLILKRLSEAAGLARTVRPHGLRHAAITEALALGITVSKVRRFSRHAKVETVMRYDDALKDDAGEVARSVGRRLK